MEYCFNKVGDLLLKRGTRGDKRFQLGSTKFYYNDKCTIVINIKINVLLLSS